METSLGTRLGLKSSSNGLDSPPQVVSSTSSVQDSGRSSIVGIENASIDRSFRVDGPEIPLEGSNHGDSFVSMDDLPTSNHFEVLDEPDPNPPISSYAYDNSYVYDLPTSNHFEVLDEPDPNPPISSYVYDNSYAYNNSYVYDLPTSNHFEVLDEPDPNPPISSYVYDNSYAYDNSYPNVM